MQIYFSKTLFSNCLANTNHQVEHHVHDPLLVLLHGFVVVLP